MRLPTINQRITLYVPSGSWKGRYAAYMEALEETTLRVAHPMFGSALVPLMPGDGVVVEYIESGQRTAFDATVIGREDRETTSLILTRPEPRAIHRQQLRDFVRLDVSLPLEYAVSGDHLGKEPPALTPGRAVDVSGGGAQIVTQEEYAVGTRLDLVLHLPDRVIFAEAEVVRQVPSEGQEGSHLGVRFTTIEERDREHIVKFIFAEQRRRRQRGLV